MREVIGTALVGMAIYFVLTHDDAWMPTAIAAAFAGILVLIGLVRGTSDGWIVGCFVVLLGTAIAGRIAEQDRARKK